MGGVVASPAVGMVTSTGRLVVVLTASKSVVVIVTCQLALTTGSESMPTRAPVHPLTCVSYLEVVSGCAVGCIPGLNSNGDGIGCWWCNSMSSNMTVMTAWH